VRPEFINSLFELAMEEQVVEPYAFNIPVGQTNSISWPALDQYFTPASGQSATYGGVQVSRKGENTQRSSSDPKLRNIEFKITDLTGLAYFSRDLIQDNFLAADLIAQEQFGKAMAWRKDWEFLNANGVGKPLGIRNCPALLTQSRNTGSHVKYEDLVNMLSKFHMARLKNAMWLANQTTFVDLISITNNAGNYVFQPNTQITQAVSPSLIGRTESNGLRYAAQGTLMGLPIRFTEKLPALGSAGDLMLIDPTQYGVATRQGLEVGISEHFAFDTDQIVYRFKIRNEGQPLWLGPYISADSANTKFSPFVQLV
jgi:HK97 family phage major capsid protein